jgi:cell division protein CrgA
VSKRTARNPTISVSGYETSIVRCAIAVLLFLLGIAWIVVYIHFAKDAALFDPKLGGKKPDDPLPWMSNLKKWNYLIGWGLILLGLMVSAHKSTPLGRGRGVVIGMLSCFLFGLFYILVYYFVGNDVDKVWVMKDLGNYNLMVGVGFMAVGFTFATRWE